MNRMMLFGLALIFPATVTSAAGDERGWEYDEHAKVVRYGTPETDDVLVTMRCGRKGSIRVEWMFSDRAVPRPKKAEMTLYPEDKEFMEDMPIGGKLSKVTFGDDHVGWSLVETTNVDSILFKFLKWGGAIHAKASTTQYILRSKGVEQIDKLQAACE
jgi:hypothetical protein